MAANSPMSPADSVPVPPIGAVDGAGYPPSGPSSEQQTQGIRFHKLLAHWAGRSRARPYVTGAALGSASLYAAQVFLRGTIGELIGVPGIPLAGLVVLGAFAGSVIFGGTATVAGSVWNALAIPHLWRRGGLWLTYKLGRMSPEQYFVLGALADYQHHCRHLPPEARPPLTKFVRDTVRWRRERMGQKEGSRKSRRKRGDTKGQPSG